MKTLRNLPLQPRRDAWVEVNLGAIEENARAIRRAIPEWVDLMAIVKADAYGHGATMVLPTLEASGVKMAGVASMDEAIHLRQSGIRMPILVIGVVPDWAVQYAAQHDIQLTIFAPHHLDSLQKAFPQIRKPFKVHIKVDTGMHRIGLPWKQAVGFIKECRNLDFVEVEGIFSHLADSHDRALSAVQLERWNQLCTEIEPLPRYVHISNSGHALMPGAFDPEIEGQGVMNNLARLGIGFFGYGTHPERQDLKLKPTMSVKARIMHIQDVAPGTGISYGYTYTTPPGETRRVATIPLGYADGVQRVLSNQIEGLLAGQRIRQVGNITMDQMMFDVTEVPEAMIGDAITLIGCDDPSGPAIWLDDWARKASTIEYEIMCGLRVRLPKTYTR
jgi:alanine racemase